MNTYTRIPTHVLLDFSAATAIVAGYLNGNAASFHASVGFTAEKCGISADTAARAIAALEENGYVRLVDGGYAATEKLNSTTDEAWTELPTDLLHRTDLKQNEKVVYAFIRSRTDHSTSCAYIHTGLSERTVQRALRQLCALGLITADKAGGGRGVCRHFSCNEGTPAQEKSQEEILQEQEELEKAREEYAWQLSVGAVGIPDELTEAATDALVHLDTLDAQDIVHVAGAQVPVHQAWEYARLVDGYALTAIAGRVMQTLERARDKQAYLLSALLTAGRETYIDIEGHDVLPLRIGKAVAA